MCDYNRSLLAEAPDEQLHRLSNLPCLPERDYLRAKPETTHVITCSGYRSKGGRHVSTYATAPNRISRWGIRPTLPAAEVADAVGTGGGRPGIIPRVSNATGSAKGYPVFLEGRYLTR